ncbi:MAG: serine/threonine-protein kinase [Planctomycetota bacterium]
MTQSDADPRFFAALVHEGLLAKSSAAKALATGDPLAYLLEEGLVTEAQWEEWVKTEAGARPVLSRYEILDSLGEGGTARVWSAHDRVEHRDVALKVLKPALAADRDALNGFVRESKLLMQLDSPHIVKGLRVAREGQIYFCAMERIDGACLQDQIGAGSRLDEEDALAAVMQVGKALCYLHAQGLVHRDVKPGNIMWTDDGRAVLIDLGFAVQRSGGASGEETDTTAGTVHYISPEQARGQDALDVRADIYSLGATLYHLVTGALPFEGASHEEVMAKQVLEALSGEAIRSLGLSPHTHYFIEKMMAKEKEIRFQDPAELVAEIEQHLERRQREQQAEQDALARRKSSRRLRRFL